MCDILTKVVFIVVPVWLMSYPVQTEQYFKSECSEANKLVVIGDRCALSEID
jgi:hypothetical protein